MAAQMKKLNKKDANHRMIVMKDNGDYMKPLNSFFGSASLNPPMSTKDVDRVEAKIYKEVEIAIKQVRSSKNLNCNIKNNHMTRTVMRKYIDYLEDIECLRITKSKQNNESNVVREILKLVPENYKISLLPSFFNNIDGERIGTVFRDTTSDFILNTKKKVMFSIAVKVFNYNHGINSVRIVLVKMDQFEG